MTQATEASLTFCPPLVALREARYLVGKEGRTFSADTGLGSLSTASNLLALRRLMLERKPNRTLEIGLAFGASALVLAASHKDLDHAATRQHVALDPYQSTVWDSVGIMTLENAGLGGYLDFRSEFSTFALPPMLAVGDQFGLIYVDGSHLFEDVFVDAYYGVRLPAKDGIIAFDDCTAGEITQLYNSGNELSYAAMA